MLQVATGRRVSTEKIHGAVVEEDLIEPSLKRKTEDGANDEWREVSEPVLMAVARIACISIAQHSR